MRFDVVESFVRGKWDDPCLCEDAVVITDGFVAVIDGVTTRGRESMIAGMTPGRFAALCGQSAFETMPSDSTALQAVAHMSVGLATALAQSGAPPDVCSKAAFGFVAYSASRHEIWRVADCPFACDGIVDSQRHEAERIQTEARTMLLECLILLGSDPETLRANDPSARIIAPLVEARLAARNRRGTPWSYGVIAREPTPIELVEVFPVRSGIREVVLASDGWPSVRSTLSESEAFLADVLRDDPLMIRRFPTTKGVAPGAISFDDRAYVRIILASEP